MLENGEETEIFSNHVRGRGRCLNCLSIDSRDVGAAWEKDTGLPLVHGTTMPLLRPLYQTWGQEVVGEEHFVIEVGAYRRIHAIAAEPPHHCSATANTPL
jgi:hypothetical protein